MSFFLQLQENGGKQTQRQLSTKPCKQDWHQMSLMPTPLMAFQDPCTAAQPEVILSQLN